MKKLDRIYMELRIEAKRIIKLANEQGIENYGMANTPINDGENKNMIKVMVNRVNIAKERIKDNAISEQDQEMETKILRVIDEYLQNRVKTIIGEPKQRGRKPGSVNKVKLFDSENNEQVEGTSEPKKRGRKSLVGTVERFETGISVNNLINWSVIDGIKEFIQNNVYAKSQLKDKTNIIYNIDEKTVIISNKPHGFEKSKLLIGESNQRGKAGSPGEFGEGMKVAFAVLLRNSKEITVQTNGFKIIPSLEVSTLDRNVKTLWYTIDNNGIREGTTVEIKGIELEDLEKACSYFILSDQVKIMSSINEKLLIDEVKNIDNIKVDINQITENERKPRLTKKELAKTNQNTILGIAENGMSKIFVNGAKIQEIPGLFNYNFINPELMNRDRSSLNSEKLKDEIRNIIWNIDNPEYMKVFINSGIDENGDFFEKNIRFGSDFTDSKKIQKRWKRIAKEIFGTKVCMRDNSSADRELSYRGFKFLNVNSGYRSFFKYVLDIKYSSDLVKSEDKTKKNVISRRELKEIEKINLKKAKSILNKYYHEVGKVKIVENLKDQWDNELNGLCDHQNNLILLNREILSSEEECFMTLFHELVHKKTGTSDETHNFEVELARGSYYLAVKSTRVQRGEVIKSNRGRKNLKNAASIQ